MLHQEIGIPQCCPFTEQKVKKKEEGGKEGGKEEKISFFFFLSLSSFSFCLSSLFSECPTPVEKRFFDAVYEGRASEV